MEILNQLDSMSLLLWLFEVTRLVSSHERRLININNCDDWRGDIMPIWSLWTVDYSVFVSQSNNWLYQNNLPIILGYRHNKQRFEQARRQQAQRRYKSGAVGSTAETHCYQQWTRRFWRWALFRYRATFFIYFLSFFHPSLHLFLMILASAL